MVYGLIERLDLLRPGNIISQLQMADRVELMTRPKLNPSIIIAGLDNKSNPKYIGVDKLHNNKWQLYPDAYQYNRDVLIVSKDDIIATINSIVMINSISVGRSDTDYTTVQMYNVDNFKFTNEDYEPQYSWTISKYARLNPQSVVAYYLNKNQEND